MVHCMCFSRSKTIKRELQRRRRTTLNYGMLGALSAVPAVSKAHELCFTIQSTVELRPCHYSICWPHRAYLSFVSFTNLIFAGIILVHDLTNKKSSQNLYRWSLEALNKDSSPTGVIVSNGYVCLFVFLFSINLR